MADGTRVRRITRPAGNVTTLAGGITREFIDGYEASALFEGIDAIATDKQGIVQWFMACAQFIMSGIAVKLTSYKTKITP